MDLKLTVDGLEKERDFYFSKLRDIELICQEHESENSPVISGIIGILYATEVSARREPPGPAVRWARRPLVRLGCAFVLPYRKASLPQRMTKWTNGTQRSRTNTSGHAPPDQTRPDQSTLCSSLTIWTFKVFHCTASSCAVSHYNRFLLTREAAVVSVCSTDPEGSHVATGW